MSLRVNFVAADSRVWSGDADMVIAPSIDGEIGILTDHEPVMTLLKEGEVRISSSMNEPSTEVTIVDITGGFLSFHENELSIVADKATIR